jgi:KaiC/GvpD/RAD55 family RecA-like ATPase
MTNKKREKIRTQCAKYGMDFGLSAIEEKVLIALRFIKQSQLSRSEARKELIKVRCHSVEHLQESINFDWL